MNTKHLFIAAILGLFLIAVIASENPFRKLKVHFADKPAEEREYDITPPSSSYLGYELVPVEEAPKEEQSDSSQTPVWSPITEPKFYELTTYNDNTYFQYALYKNQSESFIFSPESMNMALNMYSYLLTDKSAEPFDILFGDRDYFTYKDGNGIKFANRIWVNKSADVNINKAEPLKSRGLIYELDMSDSSKATREKNDYVAEKTNNFISSTPTTLNKDTVFDVMNVVYFFDKWKNQDMDEKNIYFHDYDGEEKVRAFYDDTLTEYFENEQAESASFEYENGFTFTAIVPKDGVALQDVDITAFTDPNREMVQNETHLYVPEFEIESTTVIEPSEFPVHVKDSTRTILENAEIRDEICEETCFSLITQVAKIKTDKTGTEAAAVTETRFLFFGCLPGEDEEIEPKIIYCDKPFAFFITDTNNDDIAFIGAVQNTNNMTLVDAIKVPENASKNE